MLLKRSFAIAPPPSAPLDIEFLQISSKVRFVPPAGLESAKIQGCRAENTLVQNVLCQNVKLVVGCAKRELLNVRLFAIGERMLNLIKKRKKVLVPTVATL